MTELMLLFIIGVAILLFSTQVFVATSDKASAALGLSPLVIGVTIVSIGTSLPELTVSAIALVQGDSGFAMGNVIGSNIINVFLVLGIGIIAGKVRIGTQKTQRNNLFCLSLTVAFLVLYALRITPLVSGLILLVSALALTVFEYIWGTAGRKKEDKALYSKMKVQRRPVIRFDLLLGSLAGIVAGGLITVQVIENVSYRLGISTTILGLSLSAIATSLPELMTTIFSVRDHEDKIAIGNILGSNIYNLGLIGGIILLFSSWQIITRYEIAMLLIATLMLGIIIWYYKDEYIPKMSGFILLLMFAFYILNL